MKQQIIPDFTNETNSISINVLENRTTQTVCIDKGMTIHFLYFNVHVMQFVRFINPGTQLGN